MFTKMLLFILFMAYTFRIVAPSESLFNDALYLSVLNFTVCNQHLQNLNLMQFIDASFRPPQSISLGSQGSLGNYHQCLEIRQELIDDLIEGKYCMIQIPYGNTVMPTVYNNYTDDLNGLNITKTRDLKKSYELLRQGMGVKIENEVSRAAGTEEFWGQPSIRLGICIPKTCTVQQAVGILFDNLNITYKEMFCRLPNDKVFTHIDYIAITIFSVVGLLTLASTCYDLYCRFHLQIDDKDINKPLSCGSVYTNTKRLLNFSDIPGSISCLDGIRSISIIWIVCGHTLVNSFMGFIINPLEVYEWVRSSRALWLTSANLSVDTFFMMSGLLIVYTAATKFSQRSLVRNLHWFYLHRLLRMFPLLGAAVLLQSSLLHHVHDGPNWHNFGSSVQMCQDWWWSALLHVQNYVNMAKICLPHSWYLSVDTQLHLISPLVLFWVLGCRRSAFIGLTGGLLLSLTVDIVYCYVYNFSVLSMIGMADDIDKNFKKFYVNTLTRSPPFLVGMIFGYFLHIWRGKTIQISKWYAAFIWGVATALGSGMIYLNYPALQLTRFSQNLLNALMRPLWALFLGWLIVACAKGYGGPVNWFLSLTIWKFISRISYSLYLFHYPLQFVLRTSAETSTYFTVFNFITMFIGDLVISLIFATVMCILIDAPFSTLLKVILHKKSNEPKKIGSTEILTSTG